MKYSKLVFLSAGMALCTFANAYDYTVSTTTNGTEYGFHQGKKGAPLVIAITTDIKESMTDVYSPVGGILAAKGYSVASIDVTCHGKDQQKKEKYGLDCWRFRADRSDKNIFNGYIDGLKTVIADIAARHEADHSGITVLGVSRGGYLAMKAAAEIPEIANVVALAPVTDVFRLREFDGSQASKSMYSLEPYYPALAKKHIFIQINNNDDRVGTANAIALIAGVTKAGDPRAVDLTAIITPRRSHSTSEHQTAADWVLKQKDQQTPEAQMSAPK